MTPFKWQSHQEFAKTSSIRDVITNDFTPPEMDVESDQSDSFSDTSDGDESELSEFNESDSNTFSDDGDLNHISDCSESSEFEWSDDRDSSDEDISCTVPTFSTDFRLFWDEVFAEEESQDPHAASARQYIFSKVINLLDKQTHYIEKNVSFDNELFLWRQEMERSVDSSFIPSFLNPLCLSSQDYDTCPEKDCVVFFPGNNLMDAKTCPKCGAARYDDRGRSLRQATYFSIEEFI